MSALETPLLGGRANAGSVVVVGNEVRRPASGSSEVVMALLEHVRAAGLRGVPRTFGHDEQGRERWEYLKGEVPRPPLPRWLGEPEVVGRACRFLRGFHEASRGFPGGSASNAFSHPDGGPVWGHNDLGPENVVFRGSKPVGYIDWEFAAPTDPILDLAHLARMWSGVWDSRERWARIAECAVAYGADRLDPEHYWEMLVLSQRQAFDFVRGRATSQDIAYAELWRRWGGRAYLERRLAECQAHRDELLRRLSR